jgi:hypothetical protein
MRSGYEGCVSTILTESATSIAPTGKKFKRGAVLLANAAGKMMLDRICLTYHMVTEYTPNGIYDE